MLWILLDVSIILSCIYVLEGFGEVKDLIHMVIAMAIGLVAVCGLCKINSLYYKEVVRTNDWQIVSISGGLSEGLLYVRVSDTNEVYSFDYQANDGQIKRGEVLSEHATIYKDNKCSPHIVEYTTYIQNKMNKTLWKILTFKIRTTSLTEKHIYEIYVPKGSIQLDSQ